MPIENSCKILPVHTDGDTPWVAAPKEGLATRADCLELSQCSRYINKPLQALAFASVSRCLKNVQSKLPNFVVDQALLDDIHVLASGATISAQQEANVATGLVNLEKQLLRETKSVLKVEIGAAQSRSTNAASRTRPQLIAALKAAAHNAIHDNVLSADKINEKSWEVLTALGHLALLDELMSHLQDPQKQVFACPLEIDLPAAMTGILREAHALVGPAAEGRKTRLRLFKGHVRLALTASFGPGAAIYKELLDRVGATHVATGIKNALAAPLLAPEMTSVFKAAVEPVLRAHMPSIEK